jgi:hypothetical protein
MTMKCRRCIDYYIMEKRRLEAISDLKGKNEGFTHAILKSEICNLMRETYPSERRKSLETETYVEGIGKVDVTATIGDATIAIECGTTNPKKIAALKERFDIVLHVPFCYTEDLYHLDMDELSHQITIVNVFKELRKEGLDPKRGKLFCLEDGECSLPSDRDGFPNEAIELATGYSKKEQPRSK